MHKFGESATDFNTKENPNKNSTKSDELLGREHLQEVFNSKAYLRDFYTNVEDPAMQMVLCYLPNVAARFPSNIPSLLDFGAGPTIHVATIFRNQVDNIYLADYLPQNREELLRWKRGESDFNWTATLKIITINEGTPWTELPKIEQKARDSVRDIFHCDCFAEPAISLSATAPKQFDIITTFYTLEYCCNTKAEYSNAIKSIVAYLKPEGHFIMGGVLEETWCSFDGRKFKCLYITKDFMLNCLKDAGLAIADESGVGNAKEVFFELNGMFLICCRKNRI